MFSEEQRGDGRKLEAGVAAEGTLPAACEEKSIEEPLYHIRFSVPEGGTSSRIASLIVETRHPRFPAGQCPVFSLTPLLAPAYELSPSTVAQIVAPETREESRREAIRVLLHSLGADSELARAVEAPIERSPRTEFGDDINDELEPRFRIEAHCATSFHDFLDGVCRKEVAVLRNDQMVVRFDVAQRERSLVRAEIDAVPIEMRWPILDREGEPVTLATVDNAILDFSSLLFSKRAASWGVALHAVAEELERRESERLMVHELLPREHFVYSVLAAVPEEQLCGSQRSVNPVSLALAPGGRDLKPRDLGDGGIVWLGLERTGPGVSQPRLVLSGFSLCGSEYRAEIVVPVTAERRLCSIHRELMNATSRGRFFTLLDRTLALPGARAICLAGSDVEDYPESINAVVRGLECHGGGGHLQVLRGGWPERFSLFEPHARDRVVALLRGLSPLKAERVGPSPGRSWQMECALDEELAGLVFARNGLGETVTVLLGDRGANLESRTEFLSRFFSLGGASLDELRRVASAPPGGTFRFESPGPFRVIQAVDSIALQWQQELIRSGILKDFSFAMEIPWWVEDLPRGRCALSILPVQGANFSWSACHTLVVGPHGIEAAYVSVGDRSLLGALRGSCAMRAEGQVAFSSEEQGHILRLLASPEASVSQKVAERLLIAALPHLPLRRQVGMRQQDPARDDKDFVQIARNWIGRILGLE